MNAFKILALAIFLFGNILIISNSFGCNCSRNKDYSAADIEAFYQKSEATTKVSSYKNSNPYIEKSHARDEINFQDY